MELNKKKILVTGGTGFTGAEIVNKLIEKDYFVHIISHPNDLLWRLNYKSKFKLISADLTNPIETSKIIKKLKPDIIFHLAGVVNPEIDMETIHNVYTINFGLTKNLLLALNDVDYELFINTGTGNEYGDNSPPFKEKHRESPSSPYAASKVATTHFCEMLVKSYKKPIITVRPFLIYGPKQILRAFIPSLLYSAIERKKILLSPCEQTRDFIYIEDVANAYISLAENLEKVKSMGIFNIGSGKEIQLLKIVNLILESFPKAELLIGERQYRPGETMKFFGSIKKIKNAIGWIPKWKIEEGIRATIKWWEENREIWIKFKKIWEN